MFGCALKAKPFLFFLLSLSSFLCLCPGNLSLPPFASPSATSFHFYPTIFLCKATWPAKYGIDDPYWCWVFILRYANIPEYARASTVGLWYVTADGCLYKTLNHPDSRRMPVHRQVKNECSVVHFSRSCDL
ncbi:hypothetical protein IW262DRAFT_263896 [Armillaria fumosa]|nr:hypothetical protein IW262DRAFT_263896 [Armillaria fumosa]